MDLRGWVRTSLLDYPEHIATVLFTGGCNLRCPACHNADLVLHPHDVPAVSEDEVFPYIIRRAGLIDGVVLTGGEPTMQPDLLPFLRRLRPLGLAIKIDTNGFFPDVLAIALEEGLVDYVAMDVKAPPEQYALLAGRPRLDMAPFERALALLRASAIPYELRTTVVPGLLNEDDILAIARWIQGAPRYALQQFRPVNTLDPALEQAVPYPPEALHTMARACASWVGEVQVRGE
jgi:pyruvate formate lyase activating enzyme